MFCSYLLFRRFVRSSLHGCRDGDDSTRSATSGSGGRPPCYPPPFFSAVLLCISEGDAHELHQLMGRMKAAPVQHVRFAGHGLLVSPPAAAPSPPLR